MGKKNYIKKIKNVPGFVMAQYYYLFMKYIRYNKTKFKYKVKMYSPLTFKKILKTAKANYCT